MKKLSAVLWILILSQSCNSDDKSFPIIIACDVVNPIENLQWLKSQVNAIIENESDVAPYFFIQVAEYEGETIFIQMNCCAICGSVAPLYDCNGESLGLLGDKIKIDEIKDARTIFKRTDSPCKKE